MGEKLNDFTDRYQRLQTVQKLKAIIRRLWHVTPEFADTNGKVLDSGRGTAASSRPNPFCNLCLLDREGVRKCDKTVKEITQRVKERGESKEGAVFDECHAGFKYHAFPVYHDQEWIGTVLTGGFVTEPLSDESKKEILSKVAPYHGVEIANPLEAFEQVPILNEDQVLTLDQTVQFGVEEVLDYHRDEIQRKTSLTDLVGSSINKFGHQNIVGDSKAMRQLYATLLKLNDSDSTVLISGENGTGKELVARAIHFSSGRSERPFVTQNCSALNDNLLDSELFGHMKGSFTGAVRDKKGLFEVADGGTFFMDEVGEMSPMLQVKLLRILQEGAYTPVGGTEVKSVDVRVIAATNRNLKEMVEDGRFREDLFYRLNVINIHVPSLRERRDDIPRLVDYFLNKFYRPSGVRKTITPEALDTLMAYNWPGNVRQLENEIQRAIVMSGKSLVIARENLSPQISSASASLFQVKATGSLKTMLEHLERQIILDGLRRNHWNKSRLSKELGISRATLIWKITKYGLEKQPQS